MTTKGNYYMTTKDEQLIFKCFRCKKNYEKDFNKELIQRFANIYEFCKGAYHPFERVLIHMNTWIVGKDLMKHHCLTKKRFIAT